MRLDFAIELTLLLILGAATGFIMAIMANSFVEGVSAAETFRDSLSIMEFTIAGEAYSFSSLFILLFAAAVVVGLKKLLQIDNWAGPADSILAAHTVSSVVEVKKGLASTLAAFTSAAGGGSVGQYGPLVHFGATVGSILKRFSGVRFSGDVFLGCGVAAAISAGFNAPIAGVIFAHEAILRHFSLRAVAPIFIASISASSFDQLLFPESQSTFQTMLSPAPLIEIVPYLVVAGIVFAVLALVFMLSLRYAISIGKQLQNKRIEPAFIAAAVCGTVGIFVPEILGIGAEVVNDLMQGIYSANYVGLILLLKLFLTSLCIGFGLFGGVFSPALFIGVSAGILVTALLEVLIGANLGQVMMIAGMAAISASVVGAPISVIIIVLELTGSYEYAVSAMVAVIVSSLVTHRIFGLSYFDRQLKDRGIDMSLGREDIQLSRTYLKDHISDAFLAVESTDSGKKVVEKMSQKQTTEAYVLGNNNLFIGKVDIFGAQRAEAAPITSSLIDSPLTLREDQSLKQGLKAIETFVGESVPILSKDGMFLGILTEGMLFTAASQVKTAITKLERE